MLKSSRSLAAAAILGLSLGVTCDAIGQDRGNDAYRGAVADNRSETRDAGFNPAWLGLAGLLGLLGLMPRNRRDHHGTATATHR